MKGLKNIFIGTLFISAFLFACNSNQQVLKTQTPSVAVDTTPEMKDMKAYDKFSPKVEALLNKMTIEEKIGQLNLLSPGGAVTGAVVSEDVERKIKEGKVGGIFGIKGAARIHQAQKIAVEQSRLKIPILIGLDVIHGHRTVFPIPLALSCTWDMELIENSARLAAREATADGLMWTFSPMVDIARDPRWGRIAEGAGEDPFLGSAIARAMVKGYQGDDFKSPTTMLACVKHFANYGAAEGGRDYATADMSRVKMFNEYLPPFKAAVDAGVGSIMTAFNVVDYVPASANSDLYTDILRKRWGFDGLVVTDYTAVNEMIKHGMGDLQEVSKRSLNAGIDMDMIGEGFLTTLKKSLDEGMVTEADIRQACGRILRAKELLGLFDDPYLYGDTLRAKKEILSAEQQAFARKAAGESFVLLKNENNVLPLSKNKKIALIGPLADSRRNMMGTWSVSGDHAKSVTVIEGIKSAMENSGLLQYAKGANISDNPAFAKRVNAFGQEIVIDERTPDQMITEAVNIANQSEVIVAVMGEAADMSGESSSLAHIGLQPSQRKLLEALKKTGKPIVLVLYNGRPMTLGWESENMDAILDVWFGGIQGGNAIGDVLFGTVNPGGKLTTSFPVHVGQVPVYHSMLSSGRPHAGGEKYNKFQSNYLDISNDPLYHFGYGLSYTSFGYSGITLSGNTLTPDNEITASVTVTNTGKRSGAEVVQLYIRDLVGSISRPVKELKGFEKIILSPGESKTVSFKITPELLKFYNSQLEHVWEPGEFKLMIGGSSSDTKNIEFTLKK